jgi:DNA-3-methyladenine glycosylase II
MHWIETNEGRIARSAEILTSFPDAESFLSASDEKLAEVIAAQAVRWPSRATENPVWGLMRIVMAQQLSTQVACRLADRAKSAHPQLMTPSPAAIPDAASLRSLGLSQRRAECCAEIVRRSDDLVAKVAQGLTWEQALAGIKGIGPWTIAVFQIMVLRDPDVLPLGDIGLERAIQKVYGRPRNVERLGETWRPFRSVACWYLWRTLGNEQLG